MNRHAQRSIRLLAAACAAALAVLAGATTDLVLHRRAQIEHKVFVERAAVQDFETALDSGAARIVDGQVRIDEAQLAAEVPSDRRRRLVRALASRSTVDGDRVRIDDTPVSVRNPRLEGSRSRVPRGRILDRRLRVLADSVPVPGRDCRGRIYPYREATFPVTGVAVAGARTQGLERRLDRVLTGEMEAMPSRGQVLGSTPLQTGDDVVLTVDAELQRAAYEALDGQRGAVVVLDVDTGEVLALVSAPAWDPNVWDFDLDHRTPWRNTFDPEAWEQAGYDRELRPMCDRAAGETHPPGSTFKIVTAAAWLAGGHDPAASVRCVGRDPGTRLRCHIHRNAGPSVEMDLRNAIADSCNTFFGLAGQEVGPGLAAAAHAFGFNGGFDLLTGLSGASWPTAESFAFAERGDDGTWIDHDERWYRANRYLVAQGAIGQNVVEASPLQMAVVTATVANGGHSVTPHVLKELRAGRDPADPSDTGKGYLHITGEPGEQVLAEDHVKLLQQGMADVMTDGTGRRLADTDADSGHAFIETADGRRIPIAGKTGTAEVATGDPHSWFIGYAPANAPRVAVAVMIEHGGPGALAAGPVGVAVLGWASSPVAKHL